MLWIKCDYQKNCSCWLQGKNGKASCWVAWKRLCCFQMQGIYRKRKYFKQTAYVWNILILPQNGVFFRQRLGCHIQLTVYDSPKLVRVIFPGNLRFKHTWGRKKNEGRKGDSEGGKRAGYNYRLLHVKYPCFSVQILFAFKSLSFF